MALDTSDHSRDAAGLTYVYPVVSRRAGGVSIGINLNPNSACNWACVYCQVPGLTRGSAPPIDLARLEAELDGFLARAVTDEWLEEHAPEGARRINDLAFSGNGEPTTAKEFAQCVELALRIRARHAPEVKTVLITNGSMVGRPEVARGIGLMAGARGEVWFKIDAAGPDARHAINGARGDDAGVVERLTACSRLCPTWVQTCMFTMDGLGPREEAVERYADLLVAAKEAGASLEGVLLYGLARPSLQPGAERLGRLPAERLEAIAGTIRARTALEVRVSP